MGDAKRIKEMDLRNACLHEAAHSVARQVLIGDLGETAVVKKGVSYSYPIERKPLGEMGREHLSRIAVIAAAGITAEEELCKRVGDQAGAIADDVRQIDGIQRIGGFSDEEMREFRDEAEELVRAHEVVIKKIAGELRRSEKLSGERVSEIVRVYRPGRQGEE